MNLSDYDQKSERRIHRKALLESIDFSKKLDSFSEIIDRIAAMFFFHPKFLSIKKRIPCPSIGMDASISSLEGIKELCEIGDIVDAFVILRKIRDNLFLDLFLMSEAINNHPSEFKFSCSFSELNETQMADEITRFISAALEAEEQSESLQAINRWIDGEYAGIKTKEKRRKFFGFHQYLESIENKCPKLKECHESFMKELFMELENQLNNYVHSNSPAFVSNSSIARDKESFINAVKSLLTSVDVLKRIFIVTIYLLDSTLFVTDDYSDAIEMGMNPIEGSQYYAIHQVVDEFECIKKENPGLYEFLKANNEFGIECFLD